MKAQAQPGGIAGPLARSRDDFLRTLRPTPSRDALVFAGVAALGVFLGLASIAPHGFQFGDAAIYASRIARLVPQEQPTHIGYFAMGIVFTRLIPMNADYALNLMSALLGALSVGLASTIAYTLTGRLSASVGASGILLTMYMFVQNSVQAEVYIAQLFWFLLCVQFVLWDKWVPSGLAFAAALLTTPSSFFAVPFIVLLRPQWRFVLRWVALATVVSIIVVAPFYQIYLYGSGPVDAPGLLGVRADHLGVAGSLLKEARELKGFSLTLAFIAVGLVVLAMSRPHRLFAAGLVSLWLIPLIVGERYPDVPVQFPLYAVLAVCGGIGFARLYGMKAKERWIPALAAAGLAVAVIAAAWETFPAVSNEDRAIDVYRETVLSLEPQVGDIAIGPKWATVVVKRYLVPDAKTYSCCSTPELLPLNVLDGSMGEEAQAKATDSVTDAVRSGHRVWLLHSAAVGAVGEYLEDNGYTVQAVPPSGMIGLATRPAILAPTATP